MISADEISKSYGNTQVLKNISFEVEKGDILSIVGPSGCGKTTLLHILAGLEDQSSGNYDIGGKHSTVFQDPRLLPWRKVVDNISIRNDISDEKIPEKRLNELLEMTGLRSHSEVYPHQLSGGMKQRAAFARAMAVEPDILFLDEPFSSLDYITRKELQNRFLEILNEKGITAIYVTHNLRDALKLGDTVAVMDNDPATIIREWDSDNVSDSSEIEKFLEQGYKKH